MENKKKKNILIISPFFFPELISTGKFNSDFAIALKDEGCNVTVICSHPLYPKWKVERSEAQLEGIHIIRGGANMHYSQHPVIRRVILEVWFAFYVLTKIFKYRKNADIIIPVLPPSLAFYVAIPFIGSKIQKIAMVHDLQEVYSKDKRGIMNKIISFFINKVESNIFRSCDKLIFLSNEMKETAKEYYRLPENKLFVQYPFSSLRLDTLTNDLEKILSKHKTHIVYSGALGEKQNPKGVYDFFNFASTKLENTMFHFFSQGQIFEDLKNKNINPNIKFQDLVPRSNIEELYRRSAVQVVPQLPNTSRGSLPSKLPNLLASGCKILFITDKNSEVDILFKKHNLNKVINTWDNELMLQSLVDLLKQENFNMDNQMKLSKELFSMESMINKILK